MPIDPALLRFVEEELALTPALVERTLAGSLQLLRSGQDDPAAVSERPYALALQDGLRKHAAEFERGFIDGLRERVQAQLRELAGHAPFDDAEPAAQPLELMDESRVEVDIEISRAIQLIDGTAEWELRELQTFTSTLIGQGHVSTESNPFRPALYANVLWQATGTVSAQQGPRILLLRTASGVLAGLLKNAWAASATRLEAQGVEPGIYRSITMNFGAAPHRGVPLPDVDDPSTMAGLLSAMPGGSAGMRVTVENAAIPMGSAAATGAIGAPLEQALAQLDAMLAADTPAPAALAAQRGTLLKAAATPMARQVVELVSRVFDTIAVDPKLPADYATALVRMRASAVRVALRDSEMPYTTRHPVWQFIDRVGELGRSAPKPSDPRHASTLGVCNALARHLASNLAPEAIDYQRALKQLDALLANQLQTQLQNARPAAQALHNAEQLELLTQRLGQRLTEQMATMRPTPSIRRFLVTTWARVIAAAITRDGNEAPTTRTYIKLVDDLLWSVQLPDHPKSRQRLIGLLPVILKRLRDGMAMIDVPLAERERLFGELMSIHTEALRSNHRPEDRELSPEEIVQRMREEEVLPPATGYGGFRDSLIDLPSMETVPAELMPTEPQPPAEEARLRVSALVPGMRLRIFIRGRWNTVQLLWRTEKGLFFLFAGEAAGSTHSISRRALERLAGAGLLGPLEARSLVHRALDTVMIDASRYG